MIQCIETMISLQSQLQAFYYYYFFLSQRLGASFSHAQKRLLIPKAAA